MKQLVGCLTDKLVEWNIVKSEERELYVYGFWQGTVLIFNFATVIVIGQIFQMLWQSLVFMLAYGILRPTAGGYHARTQRGCYVFSILLLLAVLGLLSFAPWTPLGGMITAMFSVVTVFLFAPVEDENKPLDEKEQQVYKKRSRWLALLLLTVTCILLMTGQRHIAYCLATAMMACAGMLVMGKKI